uniref:Uncharacterized protein n=1 Tax=Glossina pallidipes TaxID=7398 RepID=A0A1B0ABT7_GLOPL
MAFPNSGQGHKSITSKLDEFNVFERKQKHNLALRDMPLKNLKTTIASDVNVSDRTVLAAVSYNQFKMSDLNSPHPLTPSGSITVTQPPQFEMNFYDPSMSADNYIFIETRPHSENPRSSSLRILTKTISNGKAKLVFNWASNPNNPILNYDVKAYNPRSFTERFPNVRNIPTDYTPDFIRKNGSSSVPIH